jgi:hypothetical protein
MKRKYRKALIWGVIIVLAIVFAHSTEHPDLPYRAMPDSAIVASDHYDVRGRWRDFVLLPAVSNALTAVDFDVMEFRNEPGWRILIPLTTGRNTVLALTPEYGADKQPVLWGASFAGWRRLVLRFLLVTRWIPGLGRLQVAPGGSKYLQLGSKRHPSEWKVGFAMRDNVLLAALSTDGDAVRELEKRLEEKAPPPAVLKGAKPWEDAGSKLHRFWIGGDALGAFEKTIGAPMHAWISELSADNMSVGARVPRSGWIEKYLAEGDRLTGDNAKAFALGADSAFLLALLPRHTAAEYLRELFYPVSPVAPLEPEEDAVAYLTGAPFNGSLFGVRIPALTILCPGLRLARENVVSGVRRLFGTSKYPAVLENIDQKSRVLVPIRWQKGNAIFKTYPQENGVVELNRVSHGFTFCSAQMSYDAQQKASPETKAPWREWLAERLKTQSNGKPVGFLWIDVTPIADEVRQILALTKIASLVGIVRFTEEETSMINTVGSFLNAYKTGGRIAILVSDDGNGFLNLELALL